MSRPHLVGVAKNLAMMVAGEAMQSGFHFALNLALIQMLPAQSYGIFAIVMVLGGLGLTYIRALTGMPAGVWIGQSRTRGAANVYDVTFGSGALLLSILMAGGVWLLLELWLDSGAWAGGLFVGLWALRSHLRIAFFARRRPEIVSLSDLAFTTAGAGLAALALMPHQETLPTVFGALAAANAIGILVLLTLARQPVRISFRSHIRRRYAGLLRPLGWSGVSVTVANLQGQGVALLVAAIAGPAGYAPIAAALVLFVPLRVAASALVNLKQPELSAMLARREFDAVRRQCLQWTVFVGLVGLLYGGAMLVVMPYIPSHILQGSSIYLIGSFAWIIYTTTMLYVMPRIVLEALSAFKTIAWVTGLGAVVGLVSIWLILMVASPAWALGGGALSEVVVLVASWVALRSRLRRSEGALRTGRLVQAEPIGSLQQS